jgi:hypothetical protein
MRKKTVKLSVSFCFWDLQSISSMFYVSIFRTNFWRQKLQSWNITRESWNVTITSKSWAIPFRRKNASKFFLMKLTLAGAKAAHKLLVKLTLHDYDYEEQEMSSLLCWMSNLRPGLNFIDILCTAFSHTEPKSVKKTVKSSVFYAFGIYKRKSWVWIRWWNWALVFMDSLFSDFSRKFR